MHTVVGTTQLERLVPIWFDTGEGSPLSTISPYLAYFYILLAVIVITSAREPALLGEWLSPGAHVNAAGGNHWMRREVDEETVLRSEVIVVDDLDQAKIECGDLMWLEPRGSFRWDMAKELQDVVAGRVNGRPSEESITLFESMGLALEDIAAAHLVYNKAKAQGIGQELPF